VNSVLTEVARNYTVGNSGGDRRTFSRHKWTSKGRGHMWTVVDSAWWTVVASRDSGKFWFTIQCIAGQGQKQWIVDYSCGW
jgi:hypothetical protein